MGQMARMHMHAAQLSAAAQRRHSFAGIKQRHGIECCFDAVKLRQFAAAELHTHLIDLLHTHAMLAGNRAANGNTHLQNARTHRFGCVQFTWLVGIVQNQRMQIAVARMKHIGHGQTVFG